MEAFDANKKLEEYFTKIAETGLDQKFKEAGADVEKMTEAIKAYEMERIVGFLAHSVPFIFDLCSDKSTFEFLKSASNKAYMIFDNSTVPLDFVATKLHNFQVFFADTMNTKTTLNLGDQSLHDIWDHQEKDQLK